MDGKGYNRGGRPGKHLNRREYYNFARYKTAEINAEAPEGVVAGRNAVIELLKSGRCIDKL